ncbi:MAG TPA: flagellar biosynthetic protein FliO [Vulgatibacter sp.]|nr:flagellar biosynthetic protein FliO [Vulgatibacter sp.]
MLVAVALVALASGQDAPALSVRAGDAGVATEHQWAPAAGAVTAAARTKTDEFSSTPAETGGTAPSATVAGRAPGWPPSAPPKPAPAGPSTGFVVATSAIVALAAIAWTLRRRRSAGDRMFEVIEATSLGPRRSVVAVRFREELLVLGSSEAGVTLLATRSLLAQNEERATTAPDGSASSASFAGVFEAQLAAPSSEDDR